MELQIGTVSISGKYDKSTSCIIEKNTDTAEGKINRRVEISYKYFIKSLLNSFKKSMLNMTVQHNALKYK